MKLEIHKANAKASDVHIDISEVFPEHYDRANMLPVYDDEARALFEALNGSLPKETKAELVRLLSRAQG